MNTEHPHSYSKKSILKRVVAALVIAALLLVVVILPAEYGIDPTGIGEVVGLTKLSEASSGIVATGIFTFPWPYENTKETIIIPPRSGLEFKFLTGKGSVLLYTWTTPTPLYYDFHGEPTEEDGKEFLPFKSYETGTAGQASGFLVPEFIGRHGWYWQNDTENPIVVTLSASGFYEVLGIMNQSQRPQ